MSLLRNEVIAKLSRDIPQELCECLLNEYIDLKRQFALGRYRPEELYGGRFAEVLLRILEHLNDPAHPYTPFGQQPDRQKIVNRVKNNAVLHPSLRIFILSNAEILLDVRNRRDVAHVGGDINPNYADSRLVCQLADWSLTELIRLYYQCRIEEAQSVVDRINEVRIPIVAEVEGFVRIQDTSITASDSTLVALYHKKPNKQRDTDLVAWVQYKNPPRYKSEILRRLHDEAFIHYDANGYCTLLPKGVIYVEQNINLELAPKF
jgi:hypothetical protein